jgi:hypothetical protein
MKKLVITFTLGIGALLMLNGCSDGAIECDDSDAKQTVMDIIEQEFKGKLNLMANNTLDENNKFAERDPKATERIDKKYEDANPQLSDIRTEAVDDKLQKTECAAKVEYADGTQVDITYNLSKTTDNELYAEVFGNFPIFGY